MNEFLNEMEALKKKIESFPLKVDKGTKKMKEDFHKTKVNERNTLVKNEIEKYKKLNESIKSKLENIKSGLTPKDENIDYKALENEIKNKKKLLINTNEYANEEDKLGLTYIIESIADLDDSNLNSINILIKKYIDKLSNIGINLTIDDFNYSLYTYTYMKEFLANKGKTDFQDLMKKTFDNIYWSCPNLIYEFKLMLRKIFESREKEIKKAHSLIAKDETIYDNYKNALSNYKDIKFKDKFNLVKPFLDGTKNPDDYFEDSVSRVKAYDKFIISGTFNELDESGQTKYYNDIDKIKCLVEELELYNIFKPFIDEVIKRYKNKDNLKDVFKNKSKEMNKLDGERKKIVAKILPHKSLFKYVDNTKDEKLILKENEAIKNIINNLDEYETNKTDDLIITKLKDTSTYLDIIKLLASNYMMFKVLYKALKIELNDDLLFSKLTDYAYNPNISFTDDINIFNEMEISDIISNKYKLLGINLLKEDITDGIDNLKNDIEFVNDVRCMIANGITFENLHLINEINSLDTLE